jgi:hypothetical protein
LIVGLVGGVFGFLAVIVAVLIVVTQSSGSASANRSPIAAHSGMSSHGPAPSDPTHIPSYPTPASMSTAEIDAVFHTYMSGLADHDMSELRSGTCPQLRSTLHGFVLNGYYITGWTLLPYQVSPGVDQVTVKATMTQLDTYTGKPAGQVTYSWFVQRDAGGSYWVCGWLGQK